MIAGPFVLPPGPPELRSLCLAIVQSNERGIAERTVALLHGGLPEVDLVRAVTLTAAQVVDFEHVTPVLRHGLMALSAAVRMADLLPVGTDRALPLAQAVRYIAMERKRPVPLQAPPRPGSADPMALASAIRDGDADVADATVTALLTAGINPAALADTLLLPCIADLAVNGHRPIFAVEAWRLAEYAGWQHAPVILRPAVRFLAGQAKSLAEYRRIRQLVEDAAATVGMDIAAFLDAADRQRGELSEAQREQLADALRDGTHPATVVAVEALVSGANPMAVLEAAALAAARSLLHTDPPAWLGPVHGVDLIAAYRWILRRTSLPERLFAVLQAVVAAGVQPGGNPHYPRLPEPDFAGALPLDPFAMLRRRIAVRDVVGAAAVVDGLCRTGAEPLAILQALAAAAVQDNLDVSAGHHYSLVQSTAAALVAARPEDRLVHLLALTKYLAGFEKVRTVYDQLAR